VACATAGASKVQGDLDAIQQQLWKMQKDNAALLDQLTALRAQPVPAGGGAGAATETRLRIEAVERDLRAMQARSEEVDLRLAALIADLRSTREAVETLRRQAAVPAAGSTVVVPAAAGPAGGSPVGTEDAAAYPAQIPPAVGGPSGPVTTPAGAGEELYRQARADFDQGNYALALQETQEFLDRYPDHPRIGEALYLVGEIHLGQRQYSQAVAAYDVLLKSPAAGDRIPAGHYKKGLALLELNRTADAVIQLQHVVTAYPRTEEARMARERLQALGLKER
jgi:tol-pal system protein YbgF